MSQLQHVSTTTVYLVEYQGEGLLGVEFRADRDGGPMDDEAAFYAAVDYIARGVQAGNARDDYRVLERTEVLQSSSPHYVRPNRVFAAVTEYLAAVTEDEDLDRCANGCVCTEREA